jgi:8-oxo-dGTP pyrophosphatase MutT (NUDIX family)
MELRNVAVILLYNKDKEILLQHRAETAQRNPGFWAFFGGGIEKGETPLETVVRETFEELGYHLKNPKLMLVQTPPGARTMHVFMEQYDSSQKLVLNEGQDMKWISLPYPKDLKISDYDKEALSYLDGKY